MFYFLFDVEVDFLDLKPEYRDKTLAELQIPTTTGATVIGDKDDVKGLIPGPSSKTLIGKDDHLIILGSNTTLQKFMKGYTMLNYNKV